MVAGMFMLSSPSIPAANGFSPQQIPPSDRWVELTSRMPVTVLVWAGFALSTRAASGAQLTLGDRGR